jgi:hypothetical protein
MAVVLVVDLVAAWFQLPRTSSTTASMAATRGAGHVSFAGADAVAMCELHGHACAAGVHSDRNEGAGRNWNMGSERRRKKW